MPAAAKKAQKRSSKQRTVSVDALRRKHVNKALKLQEASMKDIVALATKMQKTHGKESIRLFSSDEEIDVECVSTLRPELDDWLTGIERKGELVEGSGKGVPKGRIIEIYGPESSGKTTFTLALCAAYQKQGMVAAFIDAEHAFDPKWARNQGGVDLERLLLSQPDSGEEALQITEDLAKSGKVGCIIVDSVAALVPQAELDADINKASVGRQAALMSKSLRKLKGIANKTGTTIIFINQIRMKIGVMFGNPETTSGGQALKFYASVRIDVRRVTTLKKAQLDKKTGKKKDKAYGCVTRAKIIKNKCAAPFREVKFLIDFQHGITEIGDDL